MDLFQYIIIVWMDNKTEDQLRANSTMNYSLISPAEKQALIEEYDFKPNCFFQYKTTEKADDGSEIQVKYKPEITLERVEKVTFTFLTISGHLPF